MVSALYRSGEISLPVAFEAVEKTEWVGPDEAGRTTRHAKETKNETGAPHGEYGGTDHLRTLPSASLDSLAIA